MVNEDWQNSATDPVLRLLYEAGIAVSPGAITLNLQYQLERPPSRSTVTRAIEGLSDQGLITKMDPEKPYYTLTEEGEEYAEKNISV
ncbi:helix-turn-helix domain-containing protein [Natrinema salaciae]|uniref:Transcriptional regulator PadR-like family protein n=1 Tax=Natrinema salaciae TaxID=1186196 RepID=A0A1H9LV34_9EURY|nr:hypothetical protein [Natrinema salaciae]SER15300.1 hypothetical protein SAMN04489841_3099 [Natrinema salaciae]